MILLVGLVIPTESAIICHSSYKPLRRSKSTSIFQDCSDEEERFLQRESFHRDIPTIISTTLLFRFHERIIIPRKNAGYRLQQEITCTHLFPNRIIVK